MNLTELLTAPDAFVRFYGTTPPRADVDDAILLKAASRLSGRLNPLDVEGIVVYDVQEETGRTTEQRPFPFLPTHESRDYASLLTEATGKPCVVYKCVAEMTSELLNDWLTETGRRHKGGVISLVGRATSKATAGMSLLAAMRVAADHPAAFCVGGVVIPERHDLRRSESARMLQKLKAGCAYFISQAVYSPDSVISLCRDYARDCKAHGCVPRRVILTFTPCGRQKTLEFMKWLGITIPGDTERAILAAADPLATSIEICRKNLQLIFESGIHEIVPLGFNVESVSISKAEIAGSIELWRQLEAESKRYHA